MGSWGWLGTASVVASDRFPLPEPAFWAGRNTLGEQQRGRTCLLLLLSQPETGSHAAWLERGAGVTLELPLPQGQPVVAAPAVGGEGSIGGDVLLNIVGKGEGRGKGIFLPGTGP